MGTLLIIVSIAWLASEIILNRRLRASSADRQNADKGSLRLIWITNIVAITAAIFIAPRVPVFMYTNPAFQYAGIAIIALGIILRIAAVVSLGKYFTVDVTIRKDHHLKEDGMYTYIRHPSYAASLLSFAGFGMVLNNWLSLLLILAAILTVFIRRMNIEEKVLTEQFGEEYLSYKKRTKRIVPFIY